MVLPLLPLLGTVAGGAMGLIGGAMQNSAAAAAADKQMDFQKASNERQMEFQRESAQSGYQWAVRDMEKAGINPMLAYKQGGAGTLSGASSSGSSYTPANVGTAGIQGATSGASTALAAQRNEAELANIAADTLLKASQDKTQAALQVQAMAQAGQANANSALATQQTINAWQQEDLLRQASIQNQPKSEIAKHDLAFWSSPAAAPLLTMRRWMEALQPGASIANSAANFIPKN